MFSAFGNIHGRWLIAILAAFGPCLALSQTAVSGGIRVFEHAYYLEFDPATALDMVTRTPGFNPEEQSGGRGLAGVRSNILINGKRPPPKGQSIWQQLSNQPYTNVTRIELIQNGAAPDIDMQGYNQVVNVILEEERANYYELRTAYDKTGDGDPRQRNEERKELNLTGSFFWGPHEFTLRGGRGGNRARSPAEFVAIDPANPRQRISARNEFDSERPYLELSSLFALPGDRSLSVNAETRRDERMSAPVVGPEAGQGAAVRESFGRDGESRAVSAEYRSPFGGNSELMIAVLDSLNEESTNSTFASGGDILSSVRESESGETASRLLWTWRPEEDFTLRTTLSTAFNYFGGTFSRFENGQRLPLGGSDSRVEEHRHSLTLQADWNRTDAWTLRGSLSGGAYQLETQDVAGDLQPEFKGWVSAAYQLRERTTITAESRYDIGQLGFSQFLASSNLSSDILQAGAASLDSERNWEHTLRYDQRYGDRGVVRLTLGYLKLLNPIRTVALSNSIIVSQNTFPEQRTWFDASVDYPFGRFGLDDLVLSAGFAVSGSETIDPVSREPRPVSWVRPLEWSLGLRKNPGEGQWSWGLNLWKRLYNDDYWVRETRDQWQSHEWNAFVQYEIVSGLRLSARAESPRNEMQLSRFFPAVRRGGLDPWFLAVTESRRDLATSLSLQWRRKNYLEVTATINSRPAFYSEQVLRSFSETTSTLLSREIDRSPGAQIQVRIYNR